MAPGTSYMSLAHMYKFFTLVWLKASKFGATSKKNNLSQFVWKVRKPTVLESTPVHGTRI